MAIADLNHGEVLNDGSVESELLLLELGHDSLRLIDSHHIINLLLGFMVALVRLQIRLHLVHVTRVFEERVHCLLARRNIVDVRLGLFDLFLQLLNCVLACLSRIQSHLEGLQVVNFTLNPMV